MKFRSFDALREDGFAGFVTAGELRESRCHHAPDAPGVYLVVRASADPEFLPSNPGGRFKGRNPSVPIDTLRARWVPETVVVYIGKAGGSASKATLKRRLWSYMRFGAGEPVGHWGGRLIWQLADSSSLRFCWRASLDEEPRDVERRLLAEFRAAYGSRPFANLHG